MSVRLAALTASFLLLAALAAADTIEPAGPTAEPRWQRFHDDAQAAMRQNDWRAARRPAELALDAARSFPTGDPRTAEALVALARVYGMVGLKHEAIGLQVEALELERSFGDGPAKLAQAMATLVGQYKAVGMFAEAEPLHRERLEILAGLDDTDLVFPLRELAHIVKRIRPDDDEIESLLGQALDLADHPEARANAASSLASHLAGRRDHERAASYYEQAIALELRRHREDPARLAPLRQALARQLNRTDRRTEALDQLEMTVELRERQFGSEHPYLVSALHDLGAAYADSADLEQAAGHLRRAVMLAGNARGADHGCDRALRQLLSSVEQALAAGEPLPSDATGSPTCSAADGDDDEAARRRQEISELRRRGAFPAALELAESLVADAQIAQGFFSVEASDAVALRASLQRGYGRLLDAIVSYEEALAILDRGAEDGGERRVGLLRELAYLHLSIQERATGLDYQRRGVEALELYGGAPMDRAVAIQALARQLRAAGELEEAAERFLDAADGWSRVAGDGAPEVARNLRESAACRLELDQLAVAEELLLEAADRLDAAIDPEPYAVSHADHLLARLYEKTGRPDEARLARERAAEASKRNRFDVDE